MKARCNTEPKGTSKTLQVSMDKKFICLEVQLHMYKIDFDYCYQHVGWLDLPQKVDRYGVGPKFHWLRLVYLLNRTLVATLPAEPALVQAECQLVKHLPISKGNCCR